MMKVVIRVRHLRSPFNCIGQRVPVADRGWTYCGRLLYHVMPQRKRDAVCKVCVRAQKRARALARKVKP